MSSNLLEEIIRRRSLILLLAFNDVKLRYRSSVLGFAWSFLEPLLMLTVLYFVFTHILKSDIENFPLYLLLGLIIWYMFSRATSMGLTSLVTRANIIQNIYFRREIIVVSSCLTAFIMMGFEFAAFAIFIVAFQFVPPITIVFLPLVLIVLFFLSLGLSFLLSVLNVYFRDIQFIWQVAVQAGFFLSPIFYSLDIFPENIRMILSINPMVHVLDIAREVTLYGNLPPLNSVIYLIVTTFGIFMLGYAVFKIKNKKIVEDL